MSSAAEAELGALYLNAKETVYLRQILHEMGHPQPPTPIQMDNTTASGVVNNIVQPKRTKAMDMRYHWLRDREERKQFRIFWQPGGGKSGRLLDETSPTYSPRQNTKHVPHEDLRTKITATSCETKNIIRTDKATRVC
jgi:hypothetical protein